MPGTLSNILSVCGGGEPANKLAENGTFVSTETTYCRFNQDGGGRPIWC